VTFIFQGFMEAKYEGKNFFFSANDPELKDKKFDWLGTQSFP
jgi:hypothetical protein